MTSFEAANTNTYNFRLAACVNDDSAIRRGLREFAGGGDCSHSFLLSFLLVE